MSNYQQRLMLATVALILIVMIKLELGNKLG